MGEDLTQHRLHRRKKAKRSYEWVGVSMKLGGEVRWNCFLHGGSEGERTSGQLGGGR